MRAEPGGSTAEETAFLLELTSTLLSAPLSLRDRAECLVQHLVPAVAPFASVHSRNGEALRRIAVRPSLELDLDWEDVATRGQPLGERITIVARSASRPGGGGARLFETVGVESIAIAPLAARDGPLGVLVVGFHTSDGARANESRISEIARLAGYALEKAALYDEVDRARRARDEILAIVAHDLRNPLTTARLATAQLAKSSDSAQLDTVHVVQRSIERALTLVEDLLDVSVVDGGRLSLDRTVQPVEAIVADARTLLDPIIAAAGLTLEVSIAPDAGLISCDAKRLLQVLSNLIGNATKFTPAGGSIAVRVTREAGFIRFDVSDTGRGIPAEMLPHVFERFYQATRGEKRGAGLGLPIAKGIVEQHGGKLTVASVVGEGTTFTFTIPAA